MSKHMANTWMKCMYLIILLFKYTVILYNNMDIKIYYGINNNKVLDVTETCMNKLTTNNIITIPKNDNKRSKIFGDPIYGVYKYIYIKSNNKIDEFNDSYDIYIDLINNKITTDDEYEMRIDKQINDIHSQLKINHGSFDDELPEQKMAVRYLTGNEKVLEIGGNIGRNSLIIGHILGSNAHNFVTLESDESISKQLKENRDLNNMEFHIENSALSKRKLIQRGWDTMESNILLPGYININTITLDQLNSKYNIDFDTLILDCEGAFYYILMDMPEILKNIKLIIMENDYKDLYHKIYIDTILKENNFYVDYCESGGWGPCYDNFFEVWKKK